VISALKQIRWRNRKTQVRLSILTLVITAIILALLLRNHLGTSEVGYGAVALSALVASAGLLIPVPALATACATAIFLNPFLVVIIAGSAESAGELSGYYLGYTGRDALAKNRVYQSLQKLMLRWGWVLLFVVSVIPNPIFDVVGVAAGALRYPVWKFLLIIWTGKILKFSIFAYACTASSDWLTGVFGL